MIRRDKSWMSIVGYNRIYNTDLNSSWFISSMLLYFKLNPITETYLEAVELKKELIRGTSGLTNYYFYKAMFKNIVYVLRRRGEII